MAGVSFDGSEKAGTQRICSLKEPVTGQTNSAFLGEFGCGEKRLRLRKSTIG